MYHAAKCCQIQLNKRHGGDAAAAGIDVPEHRLDAMLSKARRLDERVAQYACLLAHADHIKVQAVAAAAPMPAYADAACAASAPSATVPSKPAQAVKTEEVPEMPTNVLVKEEFVPAMPANAHVACSHLGT